MSSQPPDVWPIIGLAVLIAGIWALTHLAFVPWRRACPRCHGTGVLPAVRVGTLRPCPRCQTTGQRNPSKRHTTRHR